MNEDLDKLFKQRIQYLNAKLQQAKLKAEAHREALAHEEDEQKYLLGALRDLQEMMKYNV